MVNFIKNNISITWSLCDACRPLLYEYIPASLSTVSPLIITGIDNIINTRKFVPQLDSVIRNLELPIVFDKGYDTVIYPTIQTWYKYVKDSSTNKRINNYLLEIRLQMLKKLELENFWVKAIENFIQLNSQFYNEGKDFWKYSNIRDSQMAMNLKWLNEVKFRNEKIIVWAHSYHISKYAGHYPDVFSNPARTMGTIFTSDTSVMKSTYIIGFSSYQGIAGRIGNENYVIKKPKANSMENWINKNNYRYAFIDFKRFNLTNPDSAIPFYMSGATSGNNRYHDSELGEWTKIFDGVIYI